MDKLLGTRLRRAREEVNLSQGAFAKALGLSSEYISLLESGKRTPSFETLLKVAGFLNKNVAYFFEDKRPAFESLFAQGGQPTSGSGRTSRSSGPTCEKIPRARGADRPPPRPRPPLCPHFPRAPGRGGAAPPRARQRAHPRRPRPLRGQRLPHRPPDPPRGGPGSPASSSSTRSSKAAFALVNANEPPGLQTFIAAHLYGHYLMDRDDSPIVDNPDVVVDEYVSLYPPREQFAQTFASRFLVPPAKLRELIEKDIRSKSLGFDDVLFLKRYFGVSTRAMLRTLRGRGILPGGEVRGVLQAEPRGPGAGGLRRPLRAGGAPGADALPEIPDHSVRPATGCSLAEAAAMEKARGEHPPAPPKTGGSDE